MLRAVTDLPDPELADDGQCLAGENMQIKLAHHGRHSAVHAERDAEAGDIEQLWRLCHSAGESYQAGSGHG